MKKKILYRYGVTFLFSIFLASFLSPAKAAPPKLHFQYIVFPTSVFVDSTVGLNLCLVNQGAAGQLIYDGAVNLDHVIITIPRGPNADDLIETGTAPICSCDTGWICDVDDSGADILLTIHPDPTVNGGVVDIGEGGTTCFDVNGVEVNIEVGLAFLHVDQQFDAGRADKSKNGTIGIFKTETSSSSIVEIDPLFTASPAFNITEAMKTTWDNAYSWGDHSLVGYLTSYTETDPTVNLTKLQFLVSNDFHNLGGVDQDTQLTEAQVDSYIANNGYLTSETDPTVAASVKDGVSWNEVTNRPAGLDDGDDGITTEVDPTVPASVKDGVSWGELSGIPAGFADNVDNVGSSLWSQSGTNISYSLQDGKVAIGWISASEAVEILHLRKCPWGGSIGSVIDGLDGVGTTYLELKRNDKQWRIGCDNNDKLYLGTESGAWSEGYEGVSAKMTIKNNGFVGIGTTDPDYPLKINKGGRSWNSHGRTKYPQLMVNGNNQTGGGIAISDDGGFFDWNDGWITYEPLCCWAGLRIRGNLSVTHGKWFEIDHPTKVGYKLIHATLEGPEQAVYYRGTGQLINGQVKIVLPEYFDALTRNNTTTILLTPKGRTPFLLSYDDFDETSFIVYGSIDNGEFDWEVKAVRADIELLEVEPLAPDEPL